MATEPKSLADKIEEFVYKSPLHAEFVKEALTNYALDYDAGFYEAISPEWTDCAKDVDSIINS